MWDPRPRMEPRPPALKVSLHRWTSREVPQMLFPDLDSAPGLRGERASKARASKVLVTGLQTNSWSLLVPWCVNDPSLATTRPPGAGLQSVLCGFYTAQPGPPAPASSTSEGAVVHRSWDATISHKENWRSPVPWRSLVLVNHCPRRAPSTRQSRDPETHLQAKAQLLSLKVRCSPVTSCGDLGPRSVHAQTEAYPHATRAPVWCWPHCGASAGHVGSAVSCRSASSRLGLRCLSFQNIQAGGGTAGRAGPCSQSRPACLCPSTFSKSSICFLKGTRVYTPFKG